MTLRIALSLVLFLALAVLELSSGLERLGARREERRRDLLEFVDREQEGLRRLVEDQLGEGSLHAAHLARASAVRRHLAAPDAGTRAALQELLLPYLATFRELDKIGVLSADGQERFRCERMGTGLAALPDDLLERGPRAELVALAAEAPPGEVAVSRLLYDEERVEVAEADRRIFHYVTRVLDGEREVGVLAVTVYAAPLLHALAAFEPVPGVTSCLFDREGRVFAPDSAGGGVPEAGGPGRVEELLDADPEARRALLAGAERVETPTALFLARPTGVEPAALLTSALPTGALEAALGASGSDALATSARTLVVLAGIFVASALFVRSSLRASRLRETESYLARIREESEKQRALMEAAADLILIVDPGLERLHDTNPRAREALGLRGGADLQGARAALGEDGMERLARGVRQAADDPGSPVVVPGLRLAGADERLELDARCVGIAYGGERLVEIALSDRTRERELERRMRTAERMSSLGLLTAGVAHEVNNPLEGIGNYLSLLGRPDLDAPTRARYLDRVRTGFERIRDVVGELLRFARPKPEGGVADLRQVVERAAAMARWSRDLRSASLVVEGLEEPLPVPGSAGRLEQVVLNLLLNAGRAMGGSGRIRVAASHDESGWAVLDVEDEGPGIEETELERIFEPFYTRTGGTGLGLAVSVDIVRAHGGELSAENLSGGGARLRVRLPRGEAAGPGEEGPTDGRG